MRIFTGLMIFLAAGCTGDLVEIGPSTQADMAGSGAGGDMAQGAGGEMGPTAAVAFFPDIQKDIDTVAGCSLGACHGGSQVPVLLAGAVAGTGDANYTNFMTDVNTGAPDQSLVLTKALGMQSHGGGVKFASTSDPTYMRWLAWIQAGAPKP